MSGRAATTSKIPGNYVLSVGRTEMPAPPGWEWSVLTDVAKLETGHTPSRKHPEYWDGEIHWIGIKDARIHHGKYIQETLQRVTQLGIDNSASRLLPKGTVCLSRTASVGYALIMGSEMATSQDFVNWVCSEALQPEFLMYALMAEKDSLLKFGKGTTHTTIYFPEVKALNVCLPPQKEQKRIVSKIEELFSALDAGVSALKRARANLRRYRASVLKSAVEGRLTAAWREQHPDVEPAHELLARILHERRQRWEQQQLATYESKGKKPPKNWQSKYKEPAAPDTKQTSDSVEGGFATEVWLPIDTVIDTLEQGWSPKCERVPSPSDDKWGVIKTSAVMPMNYIQVENKRLPDALEPRSQHEVKQNDLLITRAGPRKRAAVACLVRSTRPRLIVCDKVYRITFSSEYVLPEYVEIALNSPSITDVMDEMKTGISDSGVNLTQSRFRELMIPVPSLTEQQVVVDEVARLFSVVNKTDECLVQRIGHSATLRQAILKSAFTGELRGSPSVTKCSNELVTS